MNDHIFPHTPAHCIIILHIYYRKKDKWNHTKVSLGKLLTVDFPSDLFDNLVETKFLNKLKILMPKNAEKYLTIVYGNDWNIPKVEFEYAHKYHTKKLNKLRVFR